MKRLRSKLTYANVISTLALFLVLAGGSALAAGKLGKNTVGSRQLKNGAVTTAKIKKGAVTGSKIATSTLGTVPSAAHATTADTAIAAGNATSAGNALTVGGKSAAQLTAESKLTCPAGTKIQGGLCFETSPRPAQGLANAIFTCSNEGRWLPSLGQLLAYERAHEPTSPGAEWTEPITFDGTKEWGYVGNGAMGSGGAPSSASFAPLEASEPRPFRCVTSATN
jgi:hypothetical protein